MADIIVPTLQLKIFEEVPPETIQLARNVYREVGREDWRRPDWYKSFGPKASGLKDLWDDCERLEAHPQFRTLCMKHCMTELLELVADKEFNITDFEDFASYTESLINICRCGEKFLTTSLADIAVLDANKNKADDWIQFWTRVLKKGTQPSSGHMQRRDDHEWEELQKQWTSSISRQKVEELRELLSAQRGVPLEDLKRTLKDNIVKELVADKLVCEKRAEDNLANEWGKLKNGAPESLTNGVDADGVDVPLEGQAPDDGGDGGDAGDANMIKFNTQLDSHVLAQWNAGVYASIVQSWMLCQLTSGEYSDKGLDNIVYKMPVKTDAMGKPITRLYCRPEGADAVKFFFMGRVSASMNGQSLGSKIFVDAGPVDHCQTHRYFVMPVQSTIVPNTPTPACAWMVRAVGAPTDDDADENTKAKEDPPTMKFEYVDVTLNDCCNGSKKIPDISVTLTYLVIDRSFYADPDGNEEFELKRPCLPCEVAANKLKLERKRERERKAALENSEEGILRKIGRHLLK
ncbi:unnamed protein product [Prorocentrum cordatum]|uniref:Uncharacterized protein n=1 Tax=Prorocentrum cordatum TaxID=2364126 RepID=A0ABN9W5I7_9DINO|nr:unnamed protein product [Polarella glacialis]